jgi:hypothetical protein
VDGTFAVGRCARSGPITDANGTAAGYVEVVDIAVTP